MEWASYILGVLSGLSAAGLFRVAELLVKRRAERKVDAAIASDSPLATYIGTKVEIVIQAEFGLQRGNRMDYLVDGQDVDAKWSIKSGGWMIPTEAVRELCLCMTADDDRSRLRGSDGLPVALGPRQTRRLRFTKFANYRNRALLYAGKPNWTLLDTLTTP